MSQNQETFRWGVLGPGGIARKFAKGLQVLPDHALVAVGSRSQERSDIFGDEFDVPRRYASYEELVADPEIDAIYVSTPHSFHKEHTLLCLAHGKHVLTEKPFALNAAQGEEMVAAARKAGLFLMEAMWTRFLAYHGRSAAPARRGRHRQPAHGAGRLRLPHLVQPHRPAL